MLKIIVHCLVRNEERFIWYALKSVLPHVSLIMVWDTGSVDNTIRTIESVGSSKIKLRRLGEVDAKAHTDLRRQMLRETPKGFDWLMILDGDEVWPKKSLGQVVGRLESDRQIRAVVVRTRNWVGDIYHYQSESAGHYRLAGRVGHLALRFISLKLPDLGVTHPHGGQTYTTRGKPIQGLSAPQLQFVDTCYYHATHLPRSSADNLTLKRQQKYKLELGLKVARTELPEVLFSPRSPIVSDVTAPMSLLVWVVAVVLTLPRFIRRRLLPAGEGYI